MPERVKFFLASSNRGKLAEFAALARENSRDLNFEFALAPEFDQLPLFEESAPTFAENAAGKALHYSRFCDGLIFADDSGLVVPALNGAPGVHSARYAGPNATDGDRIAKLLDELRSNRGTERAAHFVCVLALAESGRCLAVVSDRADGIILEAPRGADGFGYDPIFFTPESKKTFAELSREEKNRLSHRGKAFRRLLRAAHELFHCS